jgi:hypothetical protein
MKSIRIAGLCLVAMFVVSMVAAGTASAAPHWLVCLPTTSGSTATAWTTEQCAVAAAGGSSEWSEPKTTEVVRTQESLKLEAKSSVIGEIEVKCSGTDEGFIAPGGKSVTTKITTEKCETGTNCEELLANKEQTEKKAEAVNLPWNSELKETEGTIHSTIRAGGAKEPGWRVTCLVLGQRQENECVAESGLVVLENKNTPGNTAALLVLANFINPNKPKSNCTATGNATGNVSGSIAILLASGRGLRVSK